MRCVRSAAKIRKVDFSRISHVNSVNTIGFLHILKQFYILSPEIGYYLGAHGYLLGKPGTLN
jgi:hypothetical protein